jgi:spore coat polysaccharide biosynthesis predicted glycosyltransferase SpsG
MARTIRRVTSAGSSVGRSVAFRCDGGDVVGAGHVARCLPLAAALVAGGHHATFCGDYDGLAAWLLERSGLPVAPGAALGDGVWDAAVIDSYTLTEAEICAAAERLPVATIGEANRCAERGVLVDPHLDRLGETPTDRLLPGPAFALVDPAFAAARRDRTGPVQTVLVTVGGGTTGRPVAAAAVDAVRAAFPGARVLTAGGLALAGTEPLPFPGTLLDVIASVDVAVSAAGTTAYELAAAGVPAVIVAVAENQRRVVEGARRAGFALAGDDLPAAVAQLGDPAVRARLQQAGPATVDGRGAARAAAALAGRWWP